MHFKKLFPLLFRYGTVENVLVAHSRVKSGSPPLIVDWREVWWGTSGHRVASASAESSVFQLKGGDLKKGLASALW